jgi:signal transduction histidine kinase/CheY-like chemotaxis protein
VYLPIWSQAQSPGIDSLRSILDGANTNEKKAKVYYQVLDRITELSPDKAIIWMNETAAFGESINDSLLIGRALRVKGGALNQKEDFLGSISILEKAIIFLGNRDDKELTKAKNNLGLTLHRIGRSDKALEKLFEALTVSEKAKLEKEQSSVLNNIGMVYNDLTRYDTALEYYFKSLSIKRKINDQLSEAQTLNNIALVYEGREEFELALDYYFQSNKICENLNDPYGLALTQSNIGGVYGQMKEFSKAIEYYNKAIPVQIELGNEWGLAFSYKGMANVHKMMKKYDVALDFAKKSLALAQKLNATILLRDIYGTLTEIYKSKSDYKSALESYELHKSFEDSLSNEQVQAQITRLATEYEYDKKILAKDQENMAKEMEQKQVIKNRTYQLNILIGAFIGMIAFVIFILVNRKKIQRSKEMADAASLAKSEFLTNMSHEIRTPLNAVIGFSDLLIRTPLDENQKQYAQTVHQSANSLLDIINDVLDFSKIESGKMELDLSRTDLLDLKKQIQTIVSYSAFQKGLELNFNIEGEVPRFVQSDSVRLRQILVNLMSNAIKFTSRGSVTLKIELLSQQDQKTNLRFSVIDTGIGIEASKQKKIFDAFSQADTSTTREYGGTGLGLTISNKLLGLMGTSLKVESELNRGSIFYFDIKLNRFGSETVLVDDWSTTKRASNISEPVTTIAHDLFKSSVTFLIAEDNPVNMLLAKTLLRDLYPKANIYGAASGNEALELYRQHKPDIIFMDVQMPQKNGYETTRELRQIEVERTCVVIALTAGTVEGEKERCLLAGMDDYISKPIMRASFTESVEKWLLHIQKNM